MVTSSLSHPHKFMDFFRNRNTLAATSATPTIYNVSDRIVVFTPAPIPRSRSSLSYTHTIHTPTLPTSTLLTLFLSCLTRPRSSVVTTRLVDLVPPSWPLGPRSSVVTTRLVHQGWSRDRNTLLGLLLFLPDQPSVCETFRSLRFTV